MSPRRQEKLFKPEYAHQLIKIAQADHESAVILANHGARRENSIYHAQQCIEKSIKAVLCWKSIPVPLVHDAGILVARLPGELTPPGGYDLSDLTPFATVRRYEEGVFDVSDEEIQNALDLSKQVLDWALLHIK